MRLPRWQGLKDCSVITRNSTPVLSHPSPSARGGEQHQHWLYYTVSSLQTELSDLWPGGGSCWCGRSVCSCSWWGSSCRHSHCYHRHKWCSHRRDNREPPPSQLTVTLTLWDPVSLSSLSSLYTASPLSPPSHQLHTSHHHQPALRQTATTNSVYLSVRELSETGLQSSQHQLWQLANTTEN